MERVSEYRITSCGPLLSMYRLLCSFPSPPSFLEKSPLSDSHSFSPFFAHLPVPVSPVSRLPRDLPALISGHLQPANSPRMGKEIWNRWKRERNCASSHASGAGTWVWYWYQSQSLKNNRILNSPQTIGWVSQNTYLLIGERLLSCSLLPIEYKPNRIKNAKQARIVLKNV